MLVDLPNPLRARCGIVHVTPRLEEPPVQCLAFPGCGASAVPVPIDLGE